MDKNILLENLNKLHTTKLGIERISKNLNINNVDVLKYCYDLLVTPDCNIYKKGKNWYCEINNIRITINSYSYTIITAHLIKNNQ